MDDKELFAAYRATGDIALRNEIAEKYLYIAAVIAKKFTGRGVEYDDLYQVASLALLKGIDRFDPEKGILFSTFITPTIAGEIKNYFRDRSRLVHLPRKVAELRAELKKASEAIAAETGRKPTAAEIAERLGVPEEDVVRAAEAGSVVSLDRPVREDGLSYHDVLPAAEDPFEEVDNRDAVLSALKTLSQEERALVGFRYGQALSQVETAKRMGVSQMYVSRLERKILEKLKEQFKRGLV